MLRWAAIASSRAAMRLAVASSRPLIVHPPMAPVGATTVVGSRPLLLSSIARFPSDFSATRGYARGRSKPISSEEEEDLVDDEELDGDDEELDGDEDFDDEDDSDDGEYGRSDRD
ncbi:hypothetical protein MRB53_020063 [Persea americana]|uniref:Uncharacterized protein n=1 Tax=Persea americana TaxID=3435 RepID=A0ACC2KZS6_PERAE|nr:hypothetical protein MRB53_020063 [Persea americana]|eukprot:TRINITY_DN6517_c0_g1_i1.p1 TRINITY_DN6517_c0_g1~~TRINITY_DN6517_c0_g1_i1.p1  ORF type:complete len:115 (-),score=35.21 TRINITY_DN6517_c0_g1_i1:295-639(-)